MSKTRITKDIQGACLHERDIQRLRWFGNEGLESESHRRIALVLADDPAAASAVQAAIHSPVLCEIVELADNDNGYESGRAFWGLAEGQLVLLSLSALDSQLYQLLQSFGRERAVWINGEHVSTPPTARIVVLAPTTLPAGDLALLDHLADVTVWLTEDSEARRIEGGRL